MKDYSDEYLPTLAMKRDRAHKWGIIEDLACGTLLCLIVAAAIILWMVGEGVW